MLTESESWSKYDLTKAERKIIIASQGEKFCEISVERQFEQFTSCCLLIGAPPLDIPECAYISQSVIAEFFPWLKEHDLHLAYRLNAMSDKPVETYKRVTGESVMRILIRYFHEAQEAWQKRDEIVFADRK